MRHQPAALMKVLLISILIVLNWMLTFGALRWDYRRLTDAQRARSWSPATWGCAIYCAPYSALPWVWVTRQEWAAWRRHGLANALVQSAWLLLKGLAAVAALFAVLMLVGEGLATALGVPD
jgi:hypothetical protein